MTSDFSGRQVGQAASDFTKYAYVIKHLIWVGREVKNAPKASDVIYECYLKNLRDTFVGQWIYHVPIDRQTVGAFKIQFDKKIFQSFNFYYNNSSK